MFPVGTSSWHDEFLKFTTLRMCFIHSSSKCQGTVGNWHPGKSGHTWAVVLHHHPYLVLPGSQTLLHENRRACDGGSLKDPDLQSLPKGIVRYMLHKTYIYNIYEAS